MKTRIRIVGSLALAIGLLGANPATAGYVGGYTGDGVRIRTQPRLNATVVGLGYRSHDACLWYWAQGDWTNGTNWWVNHTNFTTSRTGFSTAALMYYYPNLYCV